MREEREKEEIEKKESKSMLNESSGKNNSIGIKYKKTKEKKRGKERQNNTHYAELLINTFLLAFCAFDGLARK